MVTPFENSVIVGSLLGDLHIQRNTSSTKFPFGVDYVFVIVLNKKNMLIGNTQFLKMIFVAKHNHLIKLVVMNMRFIHHI